MSNFKSYPTDILKNCVSHGLDELIRAWSGLGFEELIRTAEDRDRFALVIARLAEKALEEEG